MDPTGKSISVLVRARVGMNHKWDPPGFPFPLFPQQVFPFPVPPIPPNLLSNFSWPYLYILNVLGLIMRQNTKTEQKMDWVAFKPISKDPQSL